MAFDIETLDGYASQLEEGREIKIIDPKTGLETDFTMRIVSYESKRVKYAVRRLVEERRRRGRASRQATPEELEEMALTTACAAVTGWSGLKKHGKELPFNAENVREVLEKYAFVRKQVDEAAADEAAFFTNSPGR